MTDFLDKAPLPNGIYKIKGHKYLLIEEDKPYVVSRPQVTELADFGEPIPVAGPRRRILPMPEWSQVLQFIVVMLVGAILVGIVSWVAGELRRPATKGNPPLVPHGPKPPDILPTPVSDVHKLPIESEPEVLEPVPREIHIEPTHARDKEPLPPPAEEVQLPPRSEAPPRPRRKIIRPAPRVEEIPQYEVVPMIPQSGGT